MTRPVCVACAKRIPLVTHTLEVPAGYTPEEHPRHGRILKVTRRSRSVYGKDRETISVWCGEYAFMGLFHSGECAKRYGLRAALRVHGNRSRATS